MKRAGGKSSWGRRLLARGESLVASAGLTVALVLTLVMAGSGMWAHHVQTKTVAAERAARLRSMSDALARALEATLANQSPGDARLMLSEVASRQQLRVCRVVLPNGRVVVDALAPAPKANASATTDDPWPQETAPAQSERVTDATVSVQSPLAVPGRGGAILEVEADLPRTALAHDDLVAGLGVIGGAGLVVWLAAYRRARTRVRGLGAIGDALRSAAAGDDAGAVLEVCDLFGPEAAAWNAIIKERESLRERDLAVRAADALQGGAVAGRDNELVGACDALWLGMVILDDKARVKYINGAAAALLGIERESAAGADLTTLVTESRVTDSIRAAVAGGTRQRSAVEIERDGDRGKSVLRFTTRSMRRGDAASAIVLVEDVTQQRIADESRNSFVAQVTHELRTPLTTIRLYLETLVDAAEDDVATRSKCVNVIGQESRRLERVVADMLSVAEIEAGSLKLNAGDVRLDAILTELEADYKAQAQDKELTLKFELPPKLPVIKGDRDKIELALHNLMGNAVKYTPVGGTVRVIVEEDGRNLNIAVADNGIGIRPEESELIFEKFYRAKDRRIEGITGTGLGLALAREVVRLHGGDITVQSQIDKGSTFTIVLPLGAPQSGAVSVARAA